MPSRRCVRVLAYWISIGSLGCAAFAVGEDAQIIHIQGGTAYGISGGGDHVVGQARRADTSSDQGYLWSYGPPSTSTYVGTLNDFFKGSFARGVSADGKIVVGRTDKNSFAHQHAFRWMPGGPNGGQMVSLVPPGLHEGESEARAVSDDGATIVGKLEMVRNGVFTPRAVRWLGAKVIDLNPKASMTDQSGAYDVSADGKVIVGTYREESTDRHAFRWTEQTGLVDLGTFNGQFGVSHANAVSADGTVVAGYTGVNMNSRRASLWKDGVWTQLDDMGTIFESEVNDVSHNGRVAVGNIWPNAMIWDETGPHILKDYLEDYGADLTGWTRLEVAYACSRDGRTIVGVGNLGSFRAHLPLPNLVPTVEPIAARTIECVGEHNLITLQTAIEDGDGDRLKVDWYVNGALFKTFTNVAPGVASFQYDFPHGTTDVLVRVSDAVSEIQEQATTVTVQDTTDPVVVVAPTQVVSTNKGLSYATKPRLPKPQVNEACDGNPVLTNDAPDILPIGTYTVTWTVRDYSGNESTATQRIVVKDLEKPELLVTAAVTRRVDRSQIYATIKLPQPQVFDNASLKGKIVVKSNARVRYPVGTTVVTWTATDEAKNVGRATTRVTVINGKPKANAGSNIVVTAPSERGIRVRLNGSKSSDPDDHTLRYFWSAPRVKFDSARSKNPVGLFKIGATTVKLTVTDEVGAKRTDTVRVTVRLKRGSGRRSLGSAANQAFSAASSSAARSVTSAGAGKASVAGYRYAAAAEGFGVAAGEYAQWEEGQTENDGLSHYAELRYYQKLYGEQATNELMRAYAETGDESALQAALEAALGVHAAMGDLAE